MNAGTIKSDFFLAPMAEVTTPALRSVVKNFSQNIVMYTEMLSAGTVIANPHYNRDRAKLYDFDNPIIYQLAGNSPVKFSEAAKILCDSAAVGININMGCSAPLIIKKGFGAALLTDFNLSREIIRACRKAVKIQLSVKMRSGYNFSGEDYLLKFCSMLEDEGVDSIILHPRDGRLSYKRKADWKIVSLLKAKLKIPVIGNGDINDPVSAVRKIKETGCDGIMIGRAAAREPWIFKACSEIMKSGCSEFEVNQKEVFVTLLENIKKFLSPELYKSRTQRISFYFTANLMFGHELNKSLRRIDDIDKKITAVNEYFDRNHQSSIIKVKYSL